MKHPIAVVGASGFSGAEVARLVARHPDLELIAAVADRWAGDALDHHVELPVGQRSLAVAPLAEVHDAVRAAEIVLLATPAEASAKLVPELVRAGRRVVDLSGAFRLRDLEVFRRFYGFDHPAPALVHEARYALPDLPTASGPDAPPIREARVVSNPGCYATSAILGLAPLVREGLIEPEIFVDGKSGVTGAGRKLTEQYLFNEVAESVGPYRPIEHQHVPEIEQAIERVAGAPVRVTFVPHLLPIRRGLMTTSFGRLTKGTSPERLREALERTYEGAPFVRVLSAPQDVRIGRVARTLRADIAACASAERSSFVVVAALDNLLKGAASQALENACAMLGLPSGELG